MKEKNNKKRKKKLITVLSVFAFLLISFLIYSHFENTVIEVTEYTVKSERLPSGFDGYKIVQVSDLHSADFGNEHNGLIGKIKACNPDIIVVTGDLCATDKQSDIDSSVLFMKKAVKVAPVYYITGNHEAVLDKYTILMERIEALGVTVLNDEEVTVTVGEESIKLLGVSDPSFEKVTKEQEKTVMREKLSGLAPSGDSYTVLLSHRPEMFSIYSEYNIDLVFSGHAHGGQIRIPFVGGLYAPGQGIFPKYTSGVHEKNGTTLVISRGIGSSSFPFRINNNPELICVTLKKA
ncbi:MAG: metallophosphoesterase [Clostridia bacterium]|nr:metallophosphoesterase [Clostridia bacterium]